MTKSSQHEVTQLLLDWRNGDPEALENLTPLKKIVESSSEFTLQRAGRGE